MNSTDSYLPVTKPRTEATEKAGKAAHAYEQKFDIDFETLVSFSKSTLVCLHRPPVEDFEYLPDNVTIASKKVPSILNDLSILERVANSPVTTRAQRERYLQALLNVYRNLPSPHPGDLPADAPVLRVGVQREGKMLGELLGWLPASHSVCPHAKRIPLEGGLIVGVSELQPPQPVEECVIIDGAVASGATTIAIMERLKAITSQFHIYSVHATYQGLRAIARYAESAGIKVHVTVGHATNGLNSKFYAIDYSDDENRLVVGDLGDTISDLNR